MKKIILLFAFLILGMPAFSAPLTKAEKKVALNYLKLTKKQFLDSLKGLSDEQLKWKPAPNRWSVLEVAEHITLAESFLFDMVEQQVMKAAIQEGKKSEVGLDQIRQVITDRTRKATAPEPLMPGAGRIAPENMVAEFKSRRKKTMDFIKDSKEEMRSHFWPNPVFKELDAYLWIAFLSAHTERHVKQIMEVKADPNFPKK